MEKFENESEKAGTVPQVLQRLRENSLQHNTFNSFPIISGGNTFTLRPAMVKDRLNIEMVMEYNQQVVLRMVNDEEKVVRMIGWYLLRGTNATALFDLEKLESGNYRIDVLDENGNLIHTASIQKC